ncbi:hypothetical protein QBC44DRAFT_398658 [Cladorrhinum sp. PSN332]|nr:hypothetical protein QBC44DRAFT_398658 [Cladorrhinum sp. PSN332]
MAGSALTPSNNLNLTTLGEISFWADCQRTANFAIRIIDDHSPTETANRLQDPASFPYAELIELVRSVAPDPFASASRGEIVDWADGSNITEIAIKAFDDIRWIDYKRWGVCTVEFCRSLTWEGNADLAGIGVFITYIVEVVLATFFLFSLAAPHAFRSSRKKQYAYGEPINSRTDKTWAALQTSLGMFWDSALLFSVATGAASIVSTTTNLSWYDRLFMQPSMALTSCVVFATWPLYLPTCRHTFLRWLALCAVLGMFAFIASVGYWEQRFNQTAFDLFCMNVYPSEPSSDSARASFYTYLRYFGMFGSLGLCAFLILVYAVVWCWCAFLYYWKRKEGEPFDRLVASTTWLSPLPSSSPSSNGRVRGALVLAWCVLFSVVMYACLAYLAVARSVMFETAGPSLKENRWGFGQVLVLVTWLPTVLDFCLIRRGHLVALVYRLPLGVGVRFAEDEEEHC